MSLTIDYPDLNRITGWVARDVASEFYGYVDADDMQQEALTWLLEHETVLHRCTDSDGKLYATRLSQELKRYLVPLARRERTTINGGKPDDDARYTAGVVREVLPAVWTGERPVQLESEVRAPSDPARSGNWTATVLDVARALRVAVGRQDQSVLFSHYVLGYSWDDVALERDSTAGAVQRRASRAVAAVVDYLNGLAPEKDMWGGPGSRRAMPNSTAQAVTQRAYYERDL